MRRVATAAAKHMRSGDLYVDMCCGSNDFVTQLKILNKGIHCLGFDIYTPQTNGCAKLFERGNWLSQTKEVRRGNRYMK